MEEKLGTQIIPLGEKAGELTEEMAKNLALPGIAVAVGNVDAHVCVPAVGIDGPGKMLAIMGTSTCHIMMGSVEKQVPGMCGVVEDGVMPGFFGYEAGNPASVTTLRGLWKIAARILCGRSEKKRKHPCLPYGKGTAVKAR